MPKLSAKAKKAMQTKSKKPVISEVTKGKTGAKTKIPKAGKMAAKKKAAAVAKKKKK